MAIEGHSVGDDAYNQKFVGAPRAVGAAMAGCAQRVAADLDARLDAQDHAGTLDAYIEAVKADRAAADLRTIRLYAPPPFSLAPPPPDSPAIVMNAPAPARGTAPDWSGGCLACTSVGQ